MTTDKGMTEGNSSLPLPQKMGFGPPYAPKFHGSFDFRGENGQFLGKAIAAALVHRYNSHDALEAERDKLKSLIRFALEHMEKTGGLNPAAPIASMLRKAVQLDNKA